MATDAQLGHNVVLLDQRKLTDAFKYGEQARKSWIKRLINIYYYYF